METKIPFCTPRVGKEEAEAASKVILSGWLAAGKETEAFEQEFADYVGVKYAIFTNSCTSALKMAYKYFKEQGISYFSYPENTFCATYSAAVEMRVRAIPRPNLGGADPDLLGDVTGKIDRVNMHYGSVKDETPCLIEDSAHRIEPNDPLVGKIRCYSFYATKNMTTGSGGMLVTDDKEIYDRCRLYWKDGLTTSTHERQTSKGAWDYRVEAMAGGYDGNDIAAAVGRVQLRKLPQLTQRRNDIRDRYNDSFGASWEGNHLYPYFVDSFDEVKGLIEHLTENGIASGYHYPGTGWLGVSLPIFPDLTTEQQDRIIGVVKGWDETLRKSERNNTAT